MRKFLLALILVAGFLVSVAAPPASAAIECSGNWITRTGNTATWNYNQGVGLDKDVGYHAEADFMWCYDNGVRFAKVREYRFEAHWDNQDCGNFEEIHVNPNVLNWWNAPANSVPCKDSLINPYNSVSFDPDSASGTVNVYSHLPQNERCIGATAVAGIRLASDRNMPNVPSICWLD